MNTPDLRLLFPNRAENVALVRQAIGGAASTLGLPPALLADIKAAVSEACNNVVLHAYEGGEGPLEVDVRVDVGELTVVVRDRGTGIQPRAAASQTMLQGVGLSLITALSDRVEFLGDEHGTEVHMVFAAPVDRQVTAAAGAARRIDGVAPPAGAALVSVGHGPLAAPVLAAVIGSIGARSLSIERLSDTQLVTDAIAAHAESVMPDRPYLHVAAAAGEDGLSMWIGPLDQGGGDELVRETTMPGLGETSIFERLADQVEVEARDGHEHLRVRFAAR